MARLTLRRVPAYVRRWEDCGWTEALALWWEDTPWRRPRNITTLLFEPGRGWLRWQAGTYDVVEVIDPYIGGPTETYDCAPPARRAWWWLNSRLEWVARGGGYAHTVTPEGWQLFCERIARARQILEQADRLEHNDADLYVQLIKPEDIHSFDFWPLDATKDWPADIIPKVKIGTMTLNRNPVNYFQEVESIAMSPGSLVPGVEPSEDKLLQGRLFSYFDTHRHRLGPNYLQLEVNKPKAKVTNYNADSYASAGNARFEHSDINYQPSNRIDVAEDNAHKYSTQKLANVEITQ
jgi:hypothetical protein